MARDLQRNISGWLRRSAPLTDPLEPRPITVSVFYRTKDNFNTRQPVFNQPQESSTNSRLMLFIWQDRMTLATAVGDNVGPFMAGLVPTDWNNYTWTWALDNGIEYYHNGVRGGTGSRAIGGLAADTTFIGGFSPGNGLFLTDEVGEVSVYSEILTAEQIFALSRGVSPFKVDPASLLSYVPCRGGGADNAGEVDLANGSVWSPTVTSPPTVDHPWVAPPFADFGLDPGITVITGDTHQGTSLSAGIGLIAASGIKSIGAAGRTTTVSADNRTIAIQ